MPLPAALALCCICLRQDAASIANGIALRAHEPGISQENGKQAAKVVPGFCRVEQGETRYSLLSLVRPRAFQKRIRARWERCKISK